MSIDYCATKTFEEMVADRIAAGSDPAEAENEAYAISRYFEMYESYYGEMAEHFARAAQSAESARQEITKGDTTSATWYLSCVAAHAGQAQQCIAAAMMQVATDGFAD